MTVLTGQVEALCAVNHGVRMREFTGLWLNLRVKAGAVPIRHLSPLPPSIS